MFVLWRQLGTPRLPALIFPCGAAVEGNRPLNTLLRALIRECVHVEGCKYCVSCVGRGVREGGKRQRVDGPALGRPCFLSGVENYTETDSSWCEILKVELQEAALAFCTDNLIACSSKWENNKKFPCIFFRLMRITQKLPQLCVRY